MPASAVRHQHRHFKTLILLALSMTGGTFFLFWVGGLSPVTPLRGKVPAAKAWNQIAVRAVDARDARGFFHLRIDETGRLLQSSPWKAGRDEPQTPGTIHVLISCNSPEVRLTSIQTKTLADLLTELRTKHDIPADRIRVKQHH